MRPQLLKQVFPPELMDVIRRRIDTLKAGGDPGVEADHSMFHRLKKHNDPVLKEIHLMLNARVIGWLGEAVKPSYCFAAMYIKGEGICPPHVDRPQCAYTLDLCVNQNEPWALTIAGEDFFMEPGDAVLYSGTEHFHSRKKIQPDNFCDLVFFHFVPIEFGGPRD